MYVWCVRVQTKYMNLGYWEYNSKLSDPPGISLEKENKIEESLSFHQAGANMCNTIADLASLSRAKHILDVGFGYGEQIPLFLNKCGMFAKITSIRLKSSFK